MMTQKLLESIVADDSSRECQQSLTVACGQNHPPQRLLVFGLGLGRTVAEVPSRNIHQLRSWFRVFNRFHGTLIMRRSPALAPMFEIYRKECLNAVKNG